MSSQGDTPRKRKAPADFAISSSTKAAVDESKTETGCQQQVSLFSQPPAKRLRIRQPKNVGEGSKEESKKR